MKEQVAEEGKPYIISLKFQNIRKIQNNTIYCLTTQTEAV